jgi:hypothetical protein
VVSGGVPRADESSTGARSRPLPVVDADLKAAAEPQRVWPPAAASGWARSTPRWRRSGATTPPPAGGRRALAPAATRWWSSATSPRSRRPQGDLVRDKGPRVRRAGGRIGIEEATMARCLMALETPTSETIRIVAARTSEASANTLMPSTVAAIADAQPFRDAACEAERVERGSIVDSRIVPSEVAMRRPDKVLAGARRFSSTSMSACATSGACARRQGRRCTWATRRGAACGARS